MSESKTRNTPVINNIFVNALYTLMGTAIVVLITIAFTNHDNSATGHGVLTLSILKNQTLTYNLIFTIVTFLCARLIYAFLGTLIASSIKKKEEGYSYFTFFRKKLLSDFIWASMNYLSWGGLSIFIFYIEYQDYTNFRYEIFFTGAFLGSVIHHTVAAITWSLIEEILMADKSDPEDIADLYQLKLKSLFRFYFPRFSIAVTSGIMFGYYSYIFKIDSIYRQIYVNRLEIFLIIIVIFIAAYIFLIILTKNDSYFVRSLRYKNIGKIWVPLLATLLIGIELGVEIFEGLLLSNFFQNL